MTLKISPQLALPIDSATETFGILAKKGAGKSNAAVVMAEEMFDAGIPWVAIDPKGDWWGLRSSADGKKPGLPLPVFGGRHGDIPLEPGAGRMLADLILTERLTCVLDVSEFSKADVTRFLKEFADRLYRQAENEPLHLFLEEAHEYLPQMVRGDVAPLVGAWQKIVKQGRFKGLGVTLISQRSASLNKDVLTQVDTLIVLQTTSPQDRKAVKDWIDVNSGHVEAIESLPSLEKGEAWVWSPSFLSEPLTRIRFRLRRTFDSGATPKVGQARKAPATLADVDLAAIKEQMADTIEKAKADDPRELRKQISALQKELKAKPLVEQVTKVETVVEMVEIPLLDEKLVERVEAAVGRLREFGVELVSSMDVLAENLGVARTVLKARDGTGPGSTRQKPRPAPVERPRSVTRPVRAPMPAEVEDITLKAGARRIVDVVARHHPMRLTKPQIATLSNLKVTGGTWSTYWGNVKRAGLIVEQGNEVAITDAGLEYAGITEPDPMSADEILSMWRSKLKKGARAMLDVLVESYPSWVGRQQLADSVSMEVTGGTFSTYLGTLRRNGLIEVEGSEVRASEVLFIAN